jgi:hypothetical protein
MSAHQRTLGAYRLAVRLYPRRFREEYGPDLVGLAADQLRDEPTWRVLARTVVDLALTVPTRHLEDHMSRSATTLVPVIFGVVALSAVVVGVTVGHPSVILPCLAVAVIAVALALVSAHRARPLTKPRPTTRNWWKLLAGGGAVLAVLIATTTATGELPEGVWFVAMVTGLTGLVLIGAGIVLGIAHLASRANRSTAA